MAGILLLIPDPPGARKTLKIYLVDQGSADPRSIAKTLGTTSSQGGVTSYHGSGISCCPVQVGMTLAIAYHVGSRGCTCTIAIYIWQLQHLIPEPSTKYFKALRINAYADGSGISSGCRMVGNENP